MKKSIFRSGLALSMVLLAICPTWAAKAAAPKGSYLKCQVSSVKELAAQINKDPVVRNRFARHFGVRPERLTSYLLDNVKITRVTKSTPKKVYFITKNGQMVTRPRVLRPGAAIFALKDTGEPLLVQICGNPVISKLPVREKVKAEGPQELATIRVAEQPVAPPAPPAPAQPLMVAALPPTVPPPAPPVEVVTSVPAATSVTSPAVAAKVAAPLLAAAGLVRTSSDPPVVPEPAMVVAACAILAPVAFVFKRKRSS